ncbi:putative Mn2+ efflux pump MntP [Orenia metallireducens]|uniref:Putative manganese efflux pump MntP n=1 Tax=Orenia metallireducens TaxID=1413210 RepID=A0A285GKU5_9FIRM|nr:manganese efflux pump MntP family protein [Orenia metallireducens]PRX35773.1 putative Mn2+ efflux pump MntP [Orenia metallireducens]SNY24075.1 Putative Mn2+ efflux pump MntP [Orenia metallireducens]
MNIIEVVALGVALGTDAFSVSVAIGTKRLRLLLLLKFSLIIGIFHVIMPLVGVELGLFLHNLFGNYYFEGTIDKITTTIGSGVLMILGMIMIYENFKSDQVDSNFDLYGWSLIIVALSVSIDALSVGFSLGMLDANIVFSCMILGFIATVMVICGLTLGDKIGSLVSGNAEVLGGVALILLGIHFLLS